MSSKLYRRIRGAVLKFPFNEFECTADIVIHTETGDGEEMIEALADVILGAMPELPSDVMDQADTRLDQIVRMWHAQSGGRKDELRGLVDQLIENQKIIVETMVSAEAAKE
jgi:hypothetical protein